MLSPELYYERRGSGPRLLYCNGSGATLAAVRPLLRALAAQFDLLAFDYRGLGRSAPVSDPYTMADLAGDVVGLLDEVGWDRTALAGLSFGGMVAQEFAVSFPERVERLALLATSPGGTFASYPLDQLAAPDADRGYLLQLQARKGHDVLDRLHRITCPTLVGSGRYDDIAPVVNGQAIVDRVPGATLHVYDGGHLFLVEDPAALADLTAFLSTSA